MATRALPVLDGTPANEFAATPAQSPPARAAAGESLAAHSWIRRFVVAPDRVREHIELYESLGHEVRLEPVPPEELSDECSGCTLALSLFRVLYTRRLS